MLDVFKEFLGHLVISMGVDPQKKVGGTGSRPMSPLPIPPFLSPPFPSLPLSFHSPILPYPSPPLRSRLLKSSYGVWGSAVSSPSGVWGGAPAEIEFGAF